MFVDVNRGTWVVTSEAPYDEGSTYMTERRGTKSAIMIYICKKMYQKYYLCLKSKSQHMLCYL